MTIAGFFANGISYRLPHPRLDDAVLLVAHDAICRGIELLRQSPPPNFALATAGEDEITRQLQWVLENRLRKNGEVAGFDERVFRKVWRAPEVTNFDGNHPAKKPDLVFELARDETLVLSTHDALFVESKPVDKTHPLTTDYCDAGAMRFINGDYAWAMQEAMMVAYVRNGYTLAANLAPVLALEPRHSALGKPGAFQIVDAVPIAGEALYFTQHSRSFVWPGGFGPAGAIRMFHSWHTC
jgi:hypothetical protein